MDRDLLLLLDPLDNQVCLIPGESVCNNPVNFHFDPNPAEVVNATPCLSALFKRATTLLSEFTGNEILTEICSICARIAEFHATASVGRMLTALQVLLGKTQEWTQYASRHVSLEVEMESLRKLIASWRSLELKSWDQLLRGKECQYAKRACQHWLSLYEIINGESGLQSRASHHHKALRSDAWKALYKDASPWMYSVLDLCLQTTLTEHETKVIQSVFDAVDGFLRNSIVGEFPSKLHLVRLFALELQVDGKDDASKSSEFRSRLGVCISGLWHYYYQFLPVMRTFQAKLRSQVEEKITGAIKIAKWDTLSTYSLLAHSDRAHRSLTKLIKEYQTDVLDYPMSALLRKSLLGNLVSEAGELIPVEAVPSPHEMFPLLSVNDGVEVDDKLCEDAPDLSFRLHQSNVPVALPSRLVNSHKLFSKFNIYLKIILSSEASDGSCRFALRAAKLAESFVSDIFERIATLRGTASSKTMKHRALSELLNGLKEEGFSHLRSDAPIEIRSSTEILSIPIPFSAEVLSSLSTLDTAPFEKAENYYIRNLAELNQLHTQVYTV